jgi:predicted DNA-binding transcriptional regulator YafY
MTTTNISVETVSKAIQNRMWLKTVYQSYDPDTGKTLLRRRGILPFRIYQSGEGNYVVDGYDTYRSSIRTFRLDRFAEMELGNKLDITKQADPNIIARKGDYTVWPAAWNLIQAKPQIVSEKSLPKFLEHGWSLTPCPDVITKPS